MAFNGSGTYVRPSGQPVVAGTAISDSVFNTLTADLATALTTCVTRNGQSPATANLPMGTYKLTGLGDGSAATDSAAYGQIQSSANKIITVGGTADVITGSLTPTLLSYVTGDIYSFLVGSTNTTNVTINIDGLGARAITVNGATALVAGSLPSGKAVQIGYDGTQFQLLTNNYVGAASGTLPVVNGGTGVTTSTGTGAVVLGTSPTITSATLVTPLLGTPTSGVLTNCTGLPVLGGGTGVTTSTGSGANVLNTSPTLVTPLLGTPTSGVLTNCTGLPALSTASGSAPSYSARAWVKFAGANGAISESGNVTSVTRNSTGNYTVNFTTAMPTTNYTHIVTVENSGTYSATVTGSSTTSASSTILVFNTSTGAATDPTAVHAMFMA